MSRILVIEDEPLIAMMIGDCLSELGHHVVGYAVASADALQLIESAAPDAAIVDLVLADGESYAAANDLARRGIPFLILTGTTVDERYNGQAAAVLSKPIEHDQLVATLTTLCSSGPGTTAQDELEGV